MITTPTMSSTLIGQMAESTLLDEDTRERLEPGSQPQLIVQGVSVIEQVPHTFTRGVAEIEREPHTFTRGVTTIEPHPHTSTRGVTNLA